MLSERGFAIIAVLWGLAILAVISAAMITSSGVLQKEAYDNADSLRWEAIQDSLINETVLELLDDHNPKPVPIDGTLRAVETADITGEISIQDESGRIDLNAAPREVLIALMRSSGVPLATADVLADHIIEWRQVPDAKQLPGAAAAPYALAGLDYAPRQGPFQRVDEVRLVLGMTPAVYDRIAPALTVYSGRKDFDPDLAPMAALLSLPGIDGELAAAIVAARARGISYAQFVGHQPAAVSGSTKDQVKIGRAFTIVSRLHPHNGRVLERRQTIRLTNSAGAVFWTLDRSDSSPDR